MYTGRQFFGAMALAIVLAFAIGYWAGWTSVKPDAEIPFSDSANKAPLESGQSNTPPQTGTATSPGADDEISVADQSAGGTVRIEMAKLANSGWVVIHEDRNGKPGNILGARRVNAGTMKDFSIELLRPTVKGVYYAMLHADDGDRTFDHQKDSLLERNGAPVMMRFLVGEEAQSA